jgi:hypothetical protein
MAVGFPVKADYATGDVLTAAQMNDLAGTLNTVITPLGNAAGKNEIINGDFGIWQRGTSFTNPVTGDYTSDRWRVSNASANPTTRTVSQQTFTPGTAPVAGYEGTFFLRSTLTTKGTTTGARLEQRIENVRTFAGQTTTMSFWAKSDAARTNDIIIQQNFGSGGSASTEPLNTTFATTTAWTRFTFEVALPSISGKTIGTSSFLSFRVGQENTDGCVLDLWGVQVEAGSIATPFQTATGTIQGELAACQRYYHRVTVGGAVNALGVGLCDSTTSALISNSFPVAMRIAPTALEQSGSAADYLIRITGGTGITVTAVPAFSSATTVSSIITLTAASGLTGGQAAFCRSANANAYFGWSAEL